MIATNFSNLVAFNHSHFQVICVTCPLNNDESSELCMLRFLEKNRNNGTKLQDKIVGE